MVEEIRMALSGNHYLLLYAICIGISILFFAERRVNIIFPVILISAAVLNPFTYRLWHRYNDRAYWRLLWILPIVPICAFVPAHIIENKKKTWIKTALALGAALIFIIMGSFIYNNRSTTFRKTNNAEKLPDDVVEVGRALLELEDEPYVVGDSSLSVYLRQYSGQIKSMYGRDVVYGEPSTAQAAIVYQNINDDLNVVAQTMLNYDYDYLITSYNEQKNNEAINAGFRLLDRLNGYGIYRVYGNKTEHRTYNEKHQVTSISFTDENATPVLNEYGYHQIAFFYDNKNRLRREETRDCDYSLVDNSDGYAVKEYVYSRGEEKPYEYYYDHNANLVEMGSGYFHDYLRSLKREDTTILISVSDEASRHITTALMRDLHSLGIKTDLRDKYRYSFAAVISEAGIIENTSLEEIVIKGSIGTTDYCVVSAGFFAGYHSSIVIDGKEYSPNVRGINIVVYDNKKKEIIDSAGFDTFMQMIPVKR